MRAVLQRVSSAHVQVDGHTIGVIDTGWLVLLGVAQGDTERDADRLADKVLALRAFPDESGKMNRDVLEAGGGLLVVSQFTLLADCRKGRRPSFTDAAAPDKARVLYERFCDRLEVPGCQVNRGSFGAHMHVYLCNDGPVTFLLDSRAGV
jgi:D-tyrosyl-tRNA(Tyr) deacylase